MLVKHKISIVLTLTSLLVFCSCSQGGNNLNLDASNVSPRSQADAQVDNGADTALNPGSTGLPALPDTRVAMEMEPGYYSALETLVDTNGAYSIDPEGGSVVVSAEGVEMSWAIFGFPAPSPESEFNAIDLNMYLEEGQQAWIAIADYERGSWYTFPDVYEAGMLFPAIEFYEGLLSPEFNNLYVAVICMEGNSLYMAGAAAAAVSHSVTLSNLRVEYEIPGRANPKSAIVTANEASVPATATKIVVKGINFTDSCSRCSASSWNWTITGNATVKDAHEGSGGKIGTTNGPDGNENSLTHTAVAGNEITVDVNAWCDGGNHGHSNVQGNLSLTLNIT